MYDRVIETIKTIKTIKENFMNKYDVILTRETTESITLYNIASKDKARAIVKALTMAGDYGDDIEGWETDGDNFNEPAVTNVKCLSETELSTSEEAIAHLETLTDYHDLKYLVHDLADAINNDGTKKQLEFIRKHMSNVEICQTLGLKYKEK